MTPDKPSNPTKLCPTCGTRVSEDANRCLVCGTDLSSTDKPARPPKAVQGSRMPEITISLPAVLGLLALFLIVGGGLVYLAIRQVPGQAASMEASATPTETLTVTPTITSTTDTPAPSATSLPSPTPQKYVVKTGDQCLAIAITFGVSVQSIVEINPELSSDCANIREGQELWIPQPTATPTPQPTSTLSTDQATRQACELYEYTVQSNDTLDIIAANFAVPIEAIKQFNTMTADFVMLGQKLQIPLCRRLATPGATPTATPLPPYRAPNLLLPEDGAAFTLADQTISLQWDAVGTLREGEAYAVKIVDVTEGSYKESIAYVTETKYTLPNSLRPKDNAPHVLRWTVLTMRQNGTDDDGNPIWEPAGATSAARVFAWTGLPSPSTSP